MSSVKSINPCFVGNLKVKPGEQTNNSDNIPNGHDEEI